ncbi:hypothetical protein C343_06453 [Cryptococcus neoformans C23]|uniref:Uncharacterized protein n=2 Tax=Cryptococcus neoformans TaxID=5207 RepID=A0A854QB15_CRYNE|nr:hypothetical protein CNAG_06245 [Cryptococcus neoformans var. grubii H99]AUB28622.1 hypothetical protein CKF44_06245 [Cryptococcus neoformans var. grubii]OWZ27280.1 hypothetical protein C347_06452 [Cryptococcus neoformans var. grubii AD2-60a]OWZ28673.1 hypothetical protein C353_06476 [Cryptococcus neoformans var. grubii AD1-83a]OWZ39243.1 hypothetical protein C343_06453 [Cryptococcus neoformans var. grubii C23]OWZ50574.1 hypothetical protein C368_06719 [Cryptococcus neoformans var. grubii 1|eukprot:XP_012053060.1 hypothetical protein CNAG_06245 [Cryptococcus neoformans var. grubii H99]
MTMIHVVGIKTATHSGLGAVKTVLQSLKDHCIHPKTGKPYILDLRAGKQVSTEGLDKAMRAVFVMEFEVI